MGAVVIGLLVGLVLFAVLLRWRAKRKATLAGLNGERPTFTVAPPSRRLDALKREVL